MSSTNRGTVRNADDYYVTPHWLITDFINALENRSDFLLSPANYERILDPSAGGCDKYEASYPAVLASHDYQVESWDLRLDARANYKGRDFLNMQAPEQKYDMVITNPPFYLAQEFTYHALNFVCNGGLVVMLQRLNWLGSQKRKTMWQQLPLAAVFVHSKRPGFNPEKPTQTDSTEYAHFVFQKGYEDSAELIVI